MSVFQKRQVAPTILQPTSNFQVRSQNFLFSFHFTSPILWYYSPAWEPAVARSQNQSCQKPDIRFGESGDGVLIEDKLEEVQHYNIQLVDSDPAKKEVSGWIALEAGKIREFLFVIVILFFQQI